MRVGHRNIATFHNAIYTPPRNVRPLSLTHGRSLVNWTLVESIKIDQNEALQEERAMSNNKKTFSNPVVRTSKDRTS